MGPGAISGEIRIVRIPIDNMSLFELVDNLTSNGFSCVLCVLAFVMLLDKEEDIVNPQPAGFSLYPRRAFAHVCERQECQRGHLVTLGCR